MANIISTGTGINTFEHMHDRLTNGEVELIFPPYIRHDNLISGSDTEEYCKAWIKEMCKMYPNKTNLLLIGMGNPNWNSLIMCFIYDTNLLDGEGNPEYASISVIAPPIDVVIYRGSFLSYKWQFAKYTGLTQLTE